MSDFKRRVEAARAEAIRTGKTVKLTDPTDPTPAHDADCVCGTYDRCRAQRAQDARRAPNATAAFRAMHRAYND